MKTLPIVLALLPFALLSACDDDPRAGSEYDGFYQVTLNQERVSCGEEDPWTDVEPDEPYFDKYFDQMDCTQMEYLEATRL